MLLDHQEFSHRINKSFPVEGKMLKFNIIFSDGPKQTREVDVYFLKKILTLDESINLSKRFYPHRLDTIEYLSLLKLVVGFSQDGPNGVFLLLGQFIREINFKCDE